MRRQRIGERTQGKYTLDQGDVFVEDAFVLGSWKIRWAVGVWWVKRGGAASPVVFERARAMSDDFMLVIAR